MVIGLMIFLQSEHWRTARTFEKGNNQFIMPMSNGKNNISWNSALTQLFCIYLWCFKITKIINLINIIYVLLRDLTLVFIAMGQHLVLVSTTGSGWAIVSRLVHLRGSQVCWFNGQSVQDSKAQRLLCQ